MEGRLRTKTHQFGTVSRLRARAAPAPLFGAIWANWPEWVPRGAIELLSLEDHSQFQNGTLSFEDDAPFRPSEDAFCQSVVFLCSFSSILLGDLCEVAHSTAILYVRERKRGVVGEYTRTVVCVYTSDSHRVRWFSHFANAL